MTKQIMHVGSDKYYMEYEDWLNGQGKTDMDGDLMFTEQFEEETNHMFEFIEEEGEFEIEELTKEDEEAIDNRPQSLIDREKEFIQFTKDVLNNK